MEREIRRKKIEETMRLQKELKEKFEKIKREEIAEIVRETRSGDRYLLDASALINNMDRD